MAKKTNTPAKKSGNASIVNRMKSGKGISNGTQPGKMKGC